MQRRDFIRSSCTACLGVLGAGSLLSLLNGCTPLPMLKSEAQNGVITVPLSSIPADQKMARVQSKQLDFDILLVRKTDGTFNALYMQCTHQAQPLTAGKQGLFCTMHGSSFDFEGNVTQQPATAPLRKFKTEADASAVKIYINQNS
jgi:cytochrome b6-f complex iron-sulfur subunit